MCKLSSVSYVNPLCWPTSQNIPFLALYYPRKRLCTHHTCVVLEVQENTVCSLPWLALSDDNCWHNLLSEFRLSLLDSCHNHIADTSSWQTVKTRTDTLHGDDVEISGSAVIAAVHDGTTIPSVLAPYSSIRYSPGFRVRLWRKSDQISSRESNIHRETESHLELATRGTTSIRNQFYSFSNFIPAARGAQLFCWKLADTGANVRDLCHFDGKSWIVVGESKMRISLRGIKFRGSTQLTNSWCAVLA